MADLIAENTASALELEERRKILELNCREEVRQPIIRIAIEIEPTNPLARLSHEAGVEVTELRRQLETELEWINWLDTLTEAIQPDWKIKSFFAYESKEEK